MAEDALEPIGIIDLTGLTLTQIQESDNPVLRETLKGFLETRGPSIGGFQSTV